MARGMPMKGGPKGMSGGPRPKAKKGTLKRLLKMLFKSNGKLLAVVFTCLILSSVISVSSSIFLENLILQIGKGIIEGLDAVWGNLITIFIVMGCVYMAGVLCNFIYWINLSIQLFRQNRSVGNNVEVFDFCFQ